MRGAFVVLGGLGRRGGQLFVATPLASGGHDSCPTCAPERRRPMSVHYDRAATATSSAGGRRAGSARSASTTEDGGRALRRELRGDAAAAPRARRCRRGPSAEARRRRHLRLRRPARRRAGASSSGSPTAPCQRVAASRADAPPQRPGGAGRVDRSRRGQGRARDLRALLGAVARRERRPYLTKGSLVDFETHGRKRLLPPSATMPLARSTRTRPRLARGDGRAVDAGEISPKTVNNARTCLSVASTRPAVAA